MTVVDPHGITADAPDPDLAVMIPAEEGKKHGQRARSLSTSTWSSGSRGTSCTAIPSTRRSARKAIVVAAGKR
jgi:hypothetical protein